MPEGMKLVDRFNRLRTIENDSAEHRVLVPVSPARVMSVIVGPISIGYFLSAVMFSSFWSGTIADA